MNEKDRALYANANTYRIHQDNVRWTLAGGYAAFIGATVKILSDKDVTNDIFFLLSLAIAFLLIGTFYLLILGVENWYYNYFADYVRDCETQIHKSLELRTLSSFGNKHKEEISPVHPSFIFVLSIVALGNSYYIFVILRKLIHDASYCWYLLITLIYFLIILLLFRNWNKTVFPWVEKYQHLWGRPQKVDSKKE